MPDLVVLDANVWVSAFLNPHGFPAKVLAAWLDDKFRVLISLPLVDEVARTLSKPRLMLKFEYSDEDIREYLERILNRAQRVTPSGEVVPSRDPTDSPVIETALAGRAQFLVSRDEDLTRDQPFVARLATRGIAVVTVARFLQYLAESEAEPHETTSQ